MGEDSYPYEGKVTASNFQRRPASDHAPSPPPQPQDRPRNFGVPCLSLATLLLPLSWPCSSPSSYPVAHQDCDHTDSRAGRAPGPMPTGSRAC